MGVCPYSYFWWCEYFWGPWVSSFTTDEFSVRVTKLLQGLASHELMAYLSVFNLYLTQWIMAILSKGCNPDNLEPLNSLKHSFTNIEVFVPIFLNVNLFLNQTLLKFFLCGRQTWMTQLILAISLSGYLPLIQKDSITHMHGLAVYVKEGLLFTW